jgi:hypothetical protein
VVKIIGNQQEEAWAMLEAIPGIHIASDFPTEAAVDQLVRLLG